MLYAVFMYCVYFVRMYISNSHRLKQFISVTNFASVCCRRCPLHILFYTLVACRSAMYNASTGIGTNKYSMNSDFQYITNTEKWSLYIYSCERKHGDRRKIPALFFHIRNATEIETQIGITSVFARELYLRDKKFSELSRAFCTTLRINLHKSLNAGCQMVIFPTCI